MFIPPSLFPKPALKVMLGIAFFLFLFKSSILLPLFANPVTNCDPCPRTTSVSGNCDGKNGRPYITAIWVKDNKDDGEDGQCKDPSKGCNQTKLCEWKGRIFVTNVDANNTEYGSVQVKIYGPGNIKACYHLAYGDTCIKKFGTTDTTNPPITKGCSEEYPIKIQGTYGDITCTTYLTFKCGACPAPTNQ